MVSEVSGKILEIPGGSGGSSKTPWNGKSWGVEGVQIKESSIGGGGGYGYFLEPHIIKILLFFDHQSVHLFQSNQRFQETEFVDSPNLEQL